MNWLHRSQIREQRFQVIVANVFEEPPRHGLIQCTRSNMPGTHHFDEQLLVVVRNAARVRRDVRADYRPKLLATGEFHSWERFAHVVLGSVAVDAMANLRQIRAGGNRIGILLQDCAVDWLRNSVDQARQRKGDLSLRELMAYGFQRTNVNNDRRQVFIAQILEIPIRHEREKRAPIVSNAFTDGTSELIVRPGPSTRLNIGSNVGDDETHFSLVEHDATRAELAEHRRFPSLQFVEITLNLRMAIKAGRRAIH